MLVIGKMENVRGKVLIVHGGDDMLVNLKMTVEAVKALLFGET